jgi:hypothetical protein
MGRVFPFREKKRKLALRARAFDPSNATRHVISSVIGDDNKSNSNGVEFPLLAIESSSYNSGDRVALRRTSSTLPHMDDDST